MTLFVAALTVSLPTFGWVVLGLLLRHVKLLSDKWIGVFSRMAFNFGLPLMLFAGAVAVDYSTLSSAKYVLAGVLATMLIIVAAWGYSLWRGHPRELQGIFVQGAFRSNLAIIGIALAISAYGDRGAQLVALPIAVMTTLYNVLAVFVLGATLDTASSAKSVLFGILKNPLIIGISAGAALSLSGLPVPSVVAPMGSILSQFFLPVMLICIGGAMQLGDLRRTGQIAWEATIWRLCVAPLIAVGLALFMGIRGEQLGALFLLMSSPVAAASYVMVVAARGDGAMAANIIVLTTLLSVFTVTLGFFLLSVVALV